MLAALLPDPLLLPFTALAFFSVVFPFGRLPRAELFKRAPLEELHAVPSA